MTATVTVARASDRESTTGAPDRVRAAQRQAVASLAQAGAFTVAAVVAVVLAQGRWLPLHLFLAGTLVSAVSGVTVLFAVTWSAAPCPPSRLLAAQRALVGLGAAGVALSRRLDAPTPLLVVSAAAFAAGLVTLACALLLTARRGVHRRFDVATAWYVAAIAAGLVAAALGAAMGAGAGGAGLRPAHVGLNLLGLIGLVVAGTLPTFVATQGRTKPSPAAQPGRLVVLLAWQAASLATYAAGAAAAAGTATAVGLLAYAAGVAVLAGLLPRPGRRPLGWAGPRLVGLWAGLAWWVLALAVEAGRAAADQAPFAGRWLVVLVVAAYGQVLWASLAYLGPVLRGGGHVRLSAGFATTRSWVGLAAVNVAGVGLATGAPLLAPAAAAVWVVDAGLRATRLVGGRR